MSPQLPPRSRAPSRGSRQGPGWRRPTVLELLLLLAGLFCVVACAPSFSPSGPCSGDGSEPGAYPQLEALVPTIFRGTRPHQLDSGRTCTADGLGTLVGHGIREIRFAGSTWETGTDSALTLATFTTPGGPTLTVAWLAEFYEAGARAGKHVITVDASDVPIGSGISGRQIDVLNDESFQSVVVWERHGQVQVALVADFIREIQTRAAHDGLVRDAIDAWLATGQPGS